MVHATELTERAAPDGTLFLHAHFDGRTEHSDSELILTGTRLLIDLAP